MELAIATPKGNQGTVEVSEAAFGTEFNQDLIHQTVVAFWPVPVRELALRKTVQLYRAVAASHSVRKVQAERVPVLSAAQSGAVAVLHLLLSLRITVRSLIVRCTVLRCAQLSQSWLVKSA